MRRRSVAAATVCAAIVLLASAGPALAWAPQSSATVHPGVQTYTGGASFLGGGAQCTANFVYTAAGAVYLGQAAHCASTSDSTTTDGCQAKSLPLGTPVYLGTDLINGGVQPGPRIGTIAYSSWLTMQSRGEKDPNTCAYNDLALIKVDAGQVANVNPTMPFWGGPNGLAPTVSNAGDRVYSYGNSILRGGVTLLSPKTGVSLGDISGSDGWSQSVYTVTPGVPGDSGSGYLDPGGNALGVLSTVEFAPLAASNGVGTLAKELAYANTATGAGYALAPGTTPFHAPLLG